MKTAKIVLIVEDGDEYLESLSRFVPGPAYLQAHNGREALAAIAAHEVALVYLDMRFDRIPEADLLGDRERAAHAPDRRPGRAHGHAELPVILAYDFSNEASRFAHLARMHPALSWVPDTISPDEIRARLERVLGVRLEGWDQPPRR